MFQVNTPDGPRYMVVLTGPKSYRLGGIYVTRGGVLTVTKKTRDYLVRRTGFFADYDPMPAEPVEEILPPQFGQPREALVDLDELDMKRNPPLTQQEAAALSAQGTFVNQSGATVEDDDDAAPTANPADFKEDTSGDLTTADIKKTGGASTDKSAPKKSGLKVSGTPSAKKADPAPAPPADGASEAAMTVS